MGVTTAVVPTGPVSRWDRVSRIGVRLYSGSLASVSEAQVLGGANLAAVRNAAGAWEILQFASATLVATSLTDSVMWWMG